MPRARARSPTSWSAASARCSATGTTSPTTASASTSRPTTTPSADTSCTCCTAARRRAAGCARCTPRSSSTPSTSSTPRRSCARVIAGTGSDIYSCITGAIGALRGPKHGGANEVALEIQERYDYARRGRGGHPPARREQGDRDRLRASRVHRARSAQRGHQARRRETREGGRRPQAVCRSPSASKR